MLTLEVPPMPAEPSPAVPIFCRRCDNPRPLAHVAPGTLTLRHKGYERTVTGLTPAQQVWAKCPRCGYQQKILIPE